ncbi:MAG TPA: acetate/propionate family kinase [Pirellulaceae bacterium]|nr:acetate/propionate family kinase [Pirellulaceae bacterium]
MNVLVANLGSTSFKFRLYDMEREVSLARGAVESIGSSNSSVMLETGSKNERLEIVASNHGDALEYCLDRLRIMGVDCVDSAEDFAIGFKAVVGGRYRETTIVDDRVIEEMERYRDVAPAHNPPYTSAMRLFKQRWPRIPLVAAFETGFHIDAPHAFQTYAIPYEWTRDFRIVRSGFHGASHRYIAERMGLLAPSCSRLISCHLGGSSSLCAIRDGKSLGASMGMSPQIGLPQSNRCGDVDPFMLPLLIRETGYSLDQILQMLASQSGLKGMSGISNDLREILQAASDGHQQAQLAVDVYVEEIRRHMGGMMMRLHGLDAIVFTGGIGERSSVIRELVCQSLEAFGIQLNTTANCAVTGEARIDAEQGSVQIWVVPTNEEIIVARQVVALLETQKCL